MAKKTNIILSVGIVVVLLFSIGLYYYDFIDGLSDPNIPIQTPQSDNYEITPPEIKNYREKYTDET